MTSAEKYVAAAYLVVFLVVLTYVLIMALKISRLQRELAELAVLARRRQEKLDALQGEEAAEVG